MTWLYLYDDATARAFEPFALTRPCSELRAATHLVRERWEVALGVKASGSLIAEHLAQFEEFGAPPALGPATEIPSGSIVANARFAPCLGPAPAGDAWHNGERIAAVRLASPVAASRFADGSVQLETLAVSGAVRAEIDGWWLENVWDVIRYLGPMLKDDVARLAPTLAAGPVDADVRGSHAVVVEDGASLEPHVVLDAREGPILVRRGATVASFTRLVGPCAIGIDTQVLGGRIASSAIGDVCRVHGEVNSCVFLGHSNKAHDGFLGHSLIGRWANLGASTVTSNLKNTYGTVQLWTPSGMADSGLRFLGSFVGDHAKTAIGTRLTTGCVVGAGASVVLDGMSPKVISPFAWGGAADGAVYDLDKFLSTAERAMERRGVRLSEGQRATLRAAYAVRWQGHG